MFEENVKHKAQEMNDNAGYIEANHRVYKPSYTIEFNREGEVLLQIIIHYYSSRYSCDPFKHSQIYFKYPYIMYETFIPVCIWLWFNNPVDVAWYWNNVFLFAPFALWCPRMWYYRSLQYRICRMYLLRGGKVLKLETESLAGDRSTNWIETY